MSCTLLEELRDLIKLGALPHIHCSTHLVALLPDLSPRKPRAGRDRRYPHAREYNLASTVAKQGGSASTTTVTRARHTLTHGHRLSAYIAPSALITTPSWWSAMTRANTRLSVSSASECFMSMHVRSASIAYPGLSEITCSRIARRSAYDKERSDTPSNRRTSKKTKARRRLPPSEALDTSEHCVPLRSLVKLRVHRGVRKWHLQGLLLCR